MREGGRKERMNEGREKGKKGGRQEERKEGRDGGKGKRRKQDFKFHPSYFMPRIWIHSKYAIFLGILPNSVYSSVKIKAI